MRCHCFLQALLIASARSLIHWLAWWELAQACRLTGAGQIYDRACARTVISFGLCRFCKSTQFEFLHCHQVDLGRRVVTRAEGEDFATAHGMRYFETSAATGDAVTDAMHFLFEQAVRLGSWTVVSGMAGDIAYSDWRKPRSHHLELGRKMPG